MKLQLISLGVCAICAVRGGPAEQAIMAAMRLSEQSNYAWSTTVTDDAGSYDLEGRAQKGGYTWMRFPMIKAVALRLGRDAENEIEAVFKSPAVMVIRTEDGWKTWGELPRARRDRDDDPFFWPGPATSPAVPAGGPTGRMVRGGFGAPDPFGLPTVTVPWPVQLLKSNDDLRPYSNVQLAVSRPHDELSVIVSSYVDLQATGDVATGVLSEVGALLLLVHEGQEDHIQPLAAAGSFKLYIANGLVTKYLLRLEGVVQVGKKKILVHQTSTTIVKNIGSSAFDVTDEIRRKLEQ